ncbi:nucleotide sugar dehydrogenase [Thermococcus aggregans]|uniref:UDP-N-acetyl-D-mannosamine dehydrogenase n=1 Tax=Thermococcus aggregans TaxID=110163 RepID=A0A9E7MYA1_THEAG|nr:nucleotide sugar dehydrogenase [Thermococcus aggregans]USS41017.1 nucleotide sugar dehydrogenase [Thermococcus aggregans]
MKLIGLNRDEVKQAFKEGKVTIAVYGLGKMGLPLAAVFAEHGANVIGVDINEKVVEMINNGENHIKEEPGLSELVERNVKAGRLKATTDGVWAAKQTDVMIILVPTLTDDRGNLKLEPVYDVARKIAKGLKKGDIVITEATMPPGTTESLVPILEESGLKLGEFGLAHAPERTMTGTAIRDITGQYPKIVGASDEKTLEAVIGIYETINKKGVIPMSSIKAAEAVKVFEGVYRDVNIALANELALWCEEHGLDALEVFEAANTQPYCHLHMPGAGVGGHCFARDEFVFLEKDGIEPLTVEELFELIEGNLEEKEGVLIKVPSKEYYILSFDPISKRPIFKRVTLATKRKLKPGERVLEIRTKTGRRVKLTENHIVWVYEHGKFVQKLAKELKQGDKMAIVMELPSKETPEVLNVLSILSRNPHGYRVKFPEIPSEARAILHSSLAPQSYDYVRDSYIPLKYYDEFKGVLPEPSAIASGREPSYLEFPPKIEINEDFATLLGYYLSEGCLTEDSSSRIRFSFNAGERDYIEEVKEILKKIGIRYSEYTQASVHYIKVSSRAFGELLKFLETGVNSYDAKVPGFILYNKALQKAILRGIINGDGSVVVYEGKRKIRKDGKEYTIDMISATIEIATASDKLAQQLFLMLQNLGVVPSYKKNGKVHILRIFGPDNLEKLREVVSGEKKEKLEYYLNNIRKREKSSTFKHTGSFALVEVKEIKPVEYNDYVYSFEVEDTSTIVTTSGLIVHNCIPIYPWFVINLAKKMNPRLIKTAREINDFMPYHVVELTVKGLNEVGKPLNGSNVLVLGLTFRGGVREFTKSPAIPIIKELKGWGAKVYAYDPLCTPEDAKRFGAEWKEDFKDVDAIVIVTDHKEFRSLNLEEVAKQVKSKVIIDGRNVLDSEKAEKLGFVYLRVGRV